MAELASLLPAIKRILILLVVAYVAICVVAFVLERKIMYLPNQALPVIPPGMTGLVDVQLEAADGVQLRAWHWPGEKPGTVVLFHGNAGNRGNRLFWMERIHRMGYGAFVLDYRGYGGSQGSPTEEGIYRDGDAALAWLGENAPGPLVMAGTSIGGGVAVEMAKRRRPAGLILTATALSTVEIGKQAYWFLPVSLLVRDRFDSADKIGKLDCPVIVLHGDDDLIAPLSLGRAVFDRASEPKTFVVLPGVGHNDVWDADGDAYWKAVEAFLSNAFSAPR